MCWKCPAVLPDNGPTLPRIPFWSQRLWQPMPCKKRAAAAAPNRSHECYIGQIFHITPVPAIWRSGPFAMALGTD